VTTLQAWAAACQALTALYLVSCHYLVLHGWGARLSAWWHRYVPPEPTPHAHWERGWSRRTCLQVYALGLASVLMLAAAWLYSPGLGLLATSAAELAAFILQLRATWRAGQAKGQAHHDRLHPR